MIDTCLSTLMILPRVRKWGDNKLRRITSRIMPIKGGIMRESFSLEYHSGGAWGLVPACSIIISPFGRNG